ncbi:glutamate receptor U1-like isoform X2 [Nomia melanderi]|uniref:glutamate receptor U1-like isoform X2 n=1 Tax=Nomia melanderi TaxID=2448451 RepID=UPI003FCE078C
MSPASWILACSTILLGRGTLAYDDAFARLVADSVNLLFPPVTVSAHLCRVEEEDAASLSRELSGSGLMHEIHRSSKGFERLRDPEDHRVLWVLDLECDYAIPMLRAANGSGMFGAPNKWLLLQDRRTFDGTPASDGDRDGIEETFREMAVFPDSEVFLARRLRGDFTEIRSIYRRGPLSEVVLEDRGNWTADGGVLPRDLLPTSRRRRDLAGTHLRSCLVITDPDTINHLTDYENKHIDSITKANYPWMLTMVARMNATISFRMTDSWGYKDQNGSWSGMVGLLQRGEIDIGGTGMFFIKERLDVLEYVQLYSRMRSAFIFRQPLLSMISNIFALPFQRSVWIAIGVFLLAVLALLYVSSKWEYRLGTSAYWESLNPAQQTLSDNLMVVLGAMAQQGYYYEPYRVPPRIVTLMLLITALSLYASYTANIVTLLQSTADTIKTPADLLNSPLKLGAQDIVYNRYYFSQFRDPVRKAIVEEKIQPKGHKGNWMSLEEGMRRMRTELFAIHAEVGSAYKLMQETFLEDEKCGIEQIDLLNVIDPLMVMQKHSPYREIGSPNARDWTQVQGGASVLHAATQVSGTDRLH